MSDLHTLVEALSTTLKAADESGFQALCTPAGWESKGDSARRLWRQGTRKKWLVTPAGPDAAAGDRASIQVMLHTTEKVFVARTNLLCLRGDGGWRVEGVNNSKKFAELFAAGEVEALLDFRELPSDADADAWAKAATADLAKALSGLKRADDYVARASADGITLTFVESKHLEAMNRATAQYDLAQEGNDYPETMTVLLERADGAWKPVKVVDRASMNLLLG